jgi:hypothetical protein
MKPVKQEIFVGPRNRRSFDAPANTAENLFAWKIEFRRSRHLMQLAQQRTQAGDVVHAPAAAVDELPERNRLARHLYRLGDLVHPRGRELLAGQPPRHGNFLNGIAPVIHVARDPYHDCFGGQVEEGILAEPEQAGAAAVKACQLACSD